MSESNLPNSFPQLRLVEFRWSLPQHVQIPFGSGLTILHGRTQAERTAILRLIRYAWGSSSNRIGNEILQAAPNVEIDFVANGELISVDRSCEKPTGKFSVHDLSESYQFDKSEMSDFLINKLKLPQIFLKQVVKGKTRNVPLSFYDLERAFVIDFSFAKVDEMREKSV